MIRAKGAPIVVKADGLCAGKGVVVAATEAEALEAARAMLVEQRFGEAGATVILEDVHRRRGGERARVTDGERLFVLPPARDHKRVGDGDAGPNTGGMGAFAPSALLSPALLRASSARSCAPTIAGMAAEGRAFRGVLFAGIMVTPAGEPLLLEHNVRFGDPECEALMALLDGDVAELCASAARGRARPARRRDRRGSPRARRDPRGRTATRRAPRAGDAIRGPRSAPPRVRGRRRPPRRARPRATARRHRRRPRARGHRRRAARSPRRASAPTRPRSEIHFDGMHYRATSPSNGAARRRHRR